MWQLVVRCCTTAEWVRGPGGVCRTLSSLQPGSLDVCNPVNGALSSWRSALSWLGAHWQSADEVTLRLLVRGLRRARIATVQLDSMCCL